jgi:peptide/nickel transport system permease protein
VVGDLGRSIRQGRPVSNVVFTQFEHSVVLAGVSFLLAATVGILAGLIAALRRGSWIDHLIGFVTMLGFSTPAFFLGLLLIVLFSFKFPILPVGGMHSVEGSGGPLDIAKHLILPAITLAAVPITVIARTVRSSVLEITGQDFIRTARAKGLPEATVIFRHIFKNALIPVVSLLGLQIGFLLGSAAIVEVVFSYPGIGNLMIQSILERDLPVTQGCVLMLAVVYVLINIVADLVQGYLDPRIHFV